MGGLARRAALIAELRKKETVALVDGGDHFFGDLTMMDIQVPQLKLKAQVAAEGMKAIGYEAFCPGESDFAAGVAHLKALLATAGVKAVCANLKHGDTPLFDATHSVTIGSMRVGFFGLYKTDRQLPPEGEKPFVTDDPIPAARAAVAKLQAEKVDVVVALAHMNPFDLETLARTVNGIDVVLGGHPRDLVPGKQVNGAWIHHAGHQGRQVVMVKIAPQAGKRPHVSTTVVDLSLDKPEDPKLAERVKRYEEEAKKLNITIKGPSTLPPLSAEERFFGAQLCGQCHPAQDKFWKSTVHSHAYETLVRKGKATDTECLACHTAAFGRARPPNATSVIEVTGFEGVQCESCHGAGSDHPQPTIRTMARKPETCLRCHDPKNSPKFDHATWLPKMRCPSDPPRQD
jgi:hypothetical protein